jgi:hypothetical protein
MLTSCLVPSLSYQPLALSIFFNSKSLVHVSFVGCIQKMFSIWYSTRKTSTGQSLLYKYIVESYFFGILHSMFATLSNVFHSAKPGNDFGYYSKLRRMHGERVWSEHMREKEDPKFSLHPSNSQASVSTIQYLNHSTILSVDSSAQIFAHRLSLESSESQVLKLLSHPILETQCKLQLFPLSNGTTFLVGLPNGDYQIYSGERCQWSKTMTGKRVDVPLSPRSSFANCKSYKGARRRFYRDWNSSPWNSNSSNLIEISDWEKTIRRPTNYESKALLETYKKNSDPIWAFREIGSSVYIAAVDPDLDCFSIRDHRVNDRPVICYSNENSQNVESIFACCFVSDHALATSCQTWRRTEPPQNSIRIWDLRKISRTPASIHCMESFPNDHVAVIEPVREWFTSADANTTKVVTNQHYSKALGSFQAITDLIPSQDSSTMLVDVNGFNNRFRRLILFDYIRGNIVYEQSVNCGAIIAASKSLNRIIIGEKCKVGVKTQLSFYETLQNRACHKQSEISNSLIHTALTYPNLRDYVGIRTRLSCLCWNNSGTGFAGGSCDGDLFVWDGI